jgi:hypothetical protein
MEAARRAAWPGHQRFNSRTAEHSDRPGSSCRGEDRVLDDHALSGLNDTTRSAVNARDHSCRATTAGSPTNCSNDSLAQSDRRWD